MTKAVNTSADTGTRPEVTRRRQFALAPRERASCFSCDGFRLAYTNFGSGGRVVVLMHCVLGTRQLHRQLAHRLATEGFQVLTLDLLGHGDSDRPTESWRYSTPDSWAEQPLALLDHLGIDRAVIGGMSLGASVALEAAALAPERLHGLVLEMPVLDNAVLAGMLAFPPLLLTARFAPKVIRTLDALASVVPRGNRWLDFVADAFKQEPAAMAATLHGLLTGRIAPPRSIRQAIPTPALIIGHQRDPLHPFNDAQTLAADLSQSQLVHASSPMELRLDPERLTGTLIEFLDARFQHTITDNHRLRSHRAAPSRRRRALTGTDSTTSRRDNTDSHDQPQPRSPGGVVTSYAQVQSLFPLTVDGVPAQVNGGAVRTSVDLDSIGELPHHG